MGRAPCCDKANVKKGPWSPEEDAKLKEYIHKFGTVGNWIALPHKAGLKRCGKSCRLRWLNYLRPNIKHGDFSDEEDKIICSLYASIGSRWSIIAAHLPGRTDNDIKNYWNTKLKKKLIGITISKTPSSSSSYIYHNHHHHMLHNPMLNHNPSSSNTLMTMPFSSFDITQQTMQNHHHQVKDNNALLVLEGVGDDDHQVKCEDQGINIINQDYNEAYYGENSCNQSSVLDHDYGLEEIKELIINTNIDVGNNFNYFGENKENGSTKIMNY